MSFVLCVLFTISVPITDFVCSAEPTLSQGPQSFFTITWVTRRELPKALAGCGCAIINDTIYVIGGRDSTGNRYSTCYMYVPARDTWITRASMPTPRAHIACAVARGRIYAFGGWIGGTATGACEEYDPVANTWTVKNSMPTPRYTLAAVAHNDRIYLIGGMNMSGQVFATNEVYCPDSNTWIARASMPTARMGAATFLINNRIYVAGGSDLANALTVHEAYDINSNIWTSRASLSMRRYCIGAWTFQAKGYAVGGYNYLQYLPLVEVYDTLSNSWSLETPMQYSRQSTAVGLIQNRAYVIGGWNNGGLPYNEEGTIQLSITRGDGLLADDCPFAVGSNPSSHGIRLSVRNHPHPDIRLEIYDVAGKLVANVTRSLSINKSVHITLTPGIYFVNYRRQDSNITKKVVVIE